jgi:cation diffusion facilitator CzcD-associated flavoprotein CzcO
MEAYLNFVADRLDLRRDIQLKTCVTSMTFDDESATWLLETDGSDRYRAQFVIAATGLLSVPLQPAIAGMDSFAGTSVFSSRFPRDGVDFDGKRVAIIGTGSSAVQAATADRARLSKAIQRTTSPPIWRACSSSFASARSWLSATPSVGL